MPGQSTKLIGVMAQGKGQEGVVEERWIYMLLPGAYTW